MAQQERERVRVERGERREGEQLTPKLSRVERHNSWGN